MHNFISKSCNTSFSTKFQKGQLRYEQETIIITSIVPMYKSKSPFLYFSIFVILPNPQKCQTTLHN